MRNKNARKLSFKPLYQNFGPTDIKYTGRIFIEADEFEALYLMDTLGLYQEQCAERMQISRPTFSRIINSARHKVSLALIHGRKLTVMGGAQQYCIALPSDDQKSLSKHVILARYFGLLQIDDNKIIQTDWVENPIYLECQEKGLNFKNDDEAKGMAAGRIIPPLLEEANIILVLSIGEGLRRNLEGTGKVVYTTKQANMQEAIQSIIGDNT